MQTTRFLLVQGLGLLLSIVLVSVMIDGLGWRPLPGWLAAMSVYAPTTAMASWVFPAAPLSHQPQESKILMRQVGERELVHERLADTFDDLLSVYDTQRRLETLIDGFLGRPRIAGRKALDVGCGLGFFSERLVELGQTSRRAISGPNWCAGRRCWRAARPWWPTP